jgi:hypothetical protein
LAWLDARAADLLPAKSWLHPYDYFMLTRYSTLRPAEDNRPKSNFPAGKATYEHHLAVEQQHLSLCEARILRMLLPEQRQQLSALVYELNLHFEEHRSYRDKMENLRALLRAEDRNSRLEEKIRQGLEELSAIAEKLRDPLGEKLISDAIQHFNVQNVERSLFKSAHFRIFADDPSTLAMVQLYWLFRHGFELSSGESEVRVAMIRNCFSRTWGVHKVARTARSGVAAVGSDAVRKAVERFRLQ